MAKSPAAILYDASGNPFGVTANPLRIDPTAPVDSPTNVTGVITALNGVVSAPVEGYKSTAVILTGTWTGHVVFEVSGDGGTTWAQTAFSTPAGSNSIPIPRILFDVVENGTYMGFGNPVSTHTRVRASSAVTGTINVQLLRSDIPLQLLFAQTGMVQYVVGSVLNSSTVNLAAGAVFTGTSESTLGVAGLQVNVACDQPVIISIEQSTDGVAWDQTPTWVVPGGEGDGRTFQALASYFRLVCTNIGNATSTYFRLQTALCPTVEVVPKELTPNGHLSLSTSTLSFMPDPTNFSDRGQKRALRMDSDRNLQCRSTVFTDEASFRDDFIGSSIDTNLTGTCYTTNAGLYVTGVGTAFLSEVIISNTFRLSTHAYSVVSHVEEVLSDTLLKLAEPYAGASGSGTGTVAWWHYVNDAGTTLSQTGSEIVLASGTTSGSVAQALHHGDYLPIVGSWSWSISQRIANQEAVIGLQDDPNAPEARASFLIDGTTNTTIKCRSASSSTDIETTVATLPDGLTTAVKARYTIEVTSGVVVFSCNDVVLARHKLHLPDNYTVLNNVLRIKNTGTAASSTSLRVDTASLSNFNIVEIGRQVSSEPIPIRSVEEIHTVTGTITTTATTADQVILSYTVPTGKTFWIVGYTLNNGETAIRANPYKIGRNTVTTEPAGPGVVDGVIFRMGNMPASSFRDEDFSGNPRRMAIAGDVVKMTVTPSGVTSTVWRASIDFILR